MAERQYIQVILPLRLGWEPFYALPNGISVQVGDRVKVLFARKPYLAVVSRTDTQPSIDNRKVFTIQSVESDLPRVSEEEIAFWHQVADYYLCSIGEVYKLAYPAARAEEMKATANQARQDRLEDRIARLEAELAKAEASKRTWESTRERLRANLQQLREERDGQTAGPEGAPETVHDNIVLSPAQQRAYEGILKAGKKPVLLHGVTGSGKTEIYLKLAARTLSEGKSVLYLVPEIALSRQLESRVGMVFPGVQVYHSGESSARRRDIAARCRRGAPGIVLGTRSALFLPHRNLGLIIVDEEHDTSYKQTEPAPRYHARETAVMLAVQYGARMVLGSATPSLESAYNCMGGRFIRIDLSERYFHGNDAEVEVIDTVDERRKRGMIGHFSRKLIAHIQKALEAGKQVFILRSRRSYAPLLQCHECGEMPACPQCSVKLSWHQDTGRMVCHYCGYSEPYTGHCPKCGGELVSLGAGTQKIEEEARELFPEARVARLDSDTAQQAGYTRDILGRFGKGEVDILVGTQIITKGFDFERLALVAVIGADTLLGQPDFRSDEKAFQLLEQFRGRCGRRGEKGLFVIQTAQSGHPVYRNLSNLTGTESMLPERKNFGYPPFTRLICILLKDSNLQRLAYLAEELARLLADTLGTEVRISGPYAPAVDKIAGQHFRHIRLTMAKDKRLGQHKRLLAETLAAFEKERSWTGHIAIDVDPV